MIKYLLDAMNETKGQGWVCVFPRGKHFINKYEMVLNCDDKFFASIKDWWENSTFKKPYLDKGHEFNEQYGKFSEMRITDKGLELFLTLNADGIELVKSGKYNYLSPMFQDSKDSNGKAFKNVIYAVSLVNSPALLQLDELQNQIALSIDGEIKNDKIKKGGSRMELREIIASKMKLSLAADDGSILAKIEELINSGATIEDLKAKIEMMKEEMGKVAEELAAVKDEKEKACSALEVIRKSSLEAEAKTTVDLAIANGQYHPAVKDMKVEQYIANKDLVLKELSVIPKTKKDTQMTTGSKVELEISEEDKAILLDAGIDLSKPEGMEEARKILDVIGGKK